MKKLAWVVLSFGVLAGCASFKAGMARDNYLREETQTKGIGLPISTAWPALKKFVADKGYKISNLDEGAFRGETEKVAVPNENGQQRHLEFSAEAVGAGATKVVIDEITTATGKDGKQLRIGQRQPDLELAVLKQLEPERGAQIEAEAQKRYDAELNAK